MKIRKVYRLAPTRWNCLLERKLDNMPAWNGLVMTCTTKNETVVRYLKCMKPGTRVYVWTRDWTENDEYKCLQGVGYIVKNGVLLADALADDKICYFAGFNTIEIWGRVKFVGCVDKFGAYEELDKIQSVPDYDQNSIYRVPDNILVHKV